jgi:hypothetical protein
MTDRIESVFAWWLPALRAAGYDLAEIEPAHRGPIDGALRKRGIELLPATRKLAEAGGRRPLWPFAQSKFPPWA